MTDDPTPYLDPSPLTEPGEGPAEPPLRLPYDVEDVIIGVVDRRHGEHLAKLERSRGLGPRTFEPFATVARWADAAGVRLSGDTVPALLLGTIGAPTFVRTEEETINAVLQLGMQITAMGEKRRDTVFRRDVYAWTMVELMYQRIPRGANSIINSVRLVDYEPLAEADTQRTLADARLVWEIGVTDMLSITGYLPADDSTWPVEAGGNPPDPYTPPEPRPTAVPTFTLDRIPLVE